MKIKIHTQIIMALISGVVVGWLFSLWAVHLRIVGDLFIRLLKMIIIPLVMASMINGILSIKNLKHLGRIGVRTFVYYMVTTVLSILVGLLLVNLIQPGVGVETVSQRAQTVTEHTPPKISDIITDVIPSNIFKAMAEMEVLGVIFFSLLFGAALSSVRDKAGQVAAFFEGLDKVMMKLTGWIMTLAPIGVFALIASMVADNIIKAGGPGGLVELFGKLFKFVITVLGGLSIHAFITLPILLMLYAKMNPVRFFVKMSKAVMTAFSTASSAATLPVSMNSLEKEVGVSERVTSFVMPLGATVNMDGTALYEAVGAMFIAQAYGIEVGLGGQVIIVLTATLASIGAAAIPSAGLITMVIVLKAVNLPLEGIAIFWALDRILDMCRTAVNVWGDSCGAAIVAKMDGENLK